MIRKSRQASAVALAAVLGFTVAGANGSGAFAQESPQTEAPTETVAALRDPAGGVVSDANGAIRFTSQEVVQPLPNAAGDIDTPQMPDGVDSLEKLVDTLPAEGELSPDIQCLAGAIYFEARGEPLLGQLAVGQVIIDRAESGRFPSSYCGVVLQPAQFSFVRRGQMPSIDTSSPAWHNARAIALIAHEGLWESPAKGALYFHAAYVSPHWGLTRVGRVSSHIFYR